MIAAFSRLFAALGAMRAAAGDGGGRRRAGRRLRAGDDGRHPAGQRARDVRPAGDPARLLRAGRGGLARRRASGSPARVEVTCTGRTYTAAEMHAMGLVSRVVPAAELPAALDGVLADLRRASPLVMRMNVRLTRQLAGPTVRGGAPRGGAGVPRGADGDRGRARRASRRSSRSAARPGRTGEPRTARRRSGDADPDRRRRSAGRAGRGAPHARRARTSRSSRSTRRARRLLNDAGPADHAGRRRTRAAFRCRSSPRSRASRRSTSSSSPSRPTRPRTRSAPSLPRRTADDARSSRCRTASATPRRSPALVGAGARALRHHLPQHPARRPGPPALPRRASSRSRSRRSTAARRPRSRRSARCSAAPGSRPNVVAEHRPRRLAEAAPQRGGQPDVGPHRAHLPRDPRATRTCMAFMRDLCAEIVAVMRARGVPIVDEEDPFRPVIGSLKALGKNRPSMWQDLARGTRTEVDALNGAVVARGGAAGPAGAAQRGARALHPFARAAEVPAQAGDRAASSASTRPRGRRAAPAPPARAAAPRDAGRGHAGRRRAAREHAAAQGADARVLPWTSTRPSDDPDRLVACVLRPRARWRSCGRSASRPYFPENHAALIGASRQARPLHRARHGRGLLAVRQLGDAHATSAPCWRGAARSPTRTASPARPGPTSWSTAPTPATSWSAGSSSTARTTACRCSACTRRRRCDELERIDVDAAVHQLLRLTAPAGGVHRPHARHGPARRGRRATRRRPPALWSEILDLARTVPAPFTFFDTLIHIAPMVLMRGTPEAVEYYRMLKAEVEDRVAQGVAAVPGESHRFYWDGPPIWCALRPLARLFAERGRGDRRVDVLRDVRAARARSRRSDREHGARPTRASSTTGRRSTRRRTWPQQFEQYGVDAAIYHDCRTTPETSHVRYGLAARTQRADRRAGARDRGRLARPAPVLHRAAAGAARGFPRTARRTRSARQASARPRGGTDRWQTTGTRIAAGVDVGTECVKAVVADRGRPGARPRGDADARLLPGLRLRGAGGRARRRAAQGGGSRRHRRDRLRHGLRAARRRSPRPSRRATRSARSTTSGTR